MSGGELNVEQHNLKEQLCFSLYNAQRQVNQATIQIKSKIQLTHNFSAKYFMG